MLDELTDGPECADRGAARDPAHVELELVGQSQQPPVRHRRSPSARIDASLTSRSSSLIRPTSGTPASCTCRRPSARAAAILTDGSRSLREEVISNATASRDRRSQDDPQGVRRVAPDRWPFVRERLDQCDRQFGRHRPRLDMEPRRLERIGRAADRAFRRWLHVDSDHACDGTFADVDLGIAEKAGEQRKRLGPAALAQPPQGLSSNLR